MARRKKNVPLTPGGEPRVLVICPLDPRNTYYVEACKHFASGAEPLRKHCMECEEIKKWLDK